MYAVGTRKTVSILVYASVKSTYLVDKILFAIHKSLVPMSLHYHIAGSCRQITHLMSMHGYKDLKLDIWFNINSCTCLVLLQPSNWTQCLVLSICLLLLLYIHKHMYLENLFLFGLILDHSVNNFSVMLWCLFLGWTSTKQLIKCLAQRHNTVTAPSEFLN